MKKMTPLTIVQPEPVSPCIYMAEGGLATANTGYVFLAVLDIPQMISVC